jgi:hypothetical protein
MRPREGERVSSLAPVVESASAEDTADSNGSGPPEA